MNVSSSFAFINKIVGNQFNYKHNYDNDMFAYNVGFTKDRL